MNLFPQLGAPSTGTAQAPAASPLGGLFEGLMQKLHDPAVRAGLMQAGASMLNPAPGASPFAQIFTGINQGIQANQRYQDALTQQRIDQQKLAEEKMREDQKFGLSVALNNARLKQIDNAIKTSQENADSLAGYRKAKALGGGSDGGSKAFSSAWRAFYRNKVTGLVGEPVTPDLVNQWKQEFQTLEAGAPGTADASGTATGGLPAGLTMDQVQALADEQGISVEEALQALQQ